MNLSSWLKVSYMKKFVCKNCGVVNQASNEVVGSNGDWLQCVLPQGFEWILPAGKITPIVGEPIYISGMGEHLSKEAYLKKYNIDPEIAYNLMRGNTRYRSRSANSASRTTNKTQTSLKKKAQSWLDEDDWTSWGDCTGPILIIIMNPTTVWSTDAPSSRIENWVQVSMQERLICYLY